MEIVLEHIKVDDEFINKNNDPMVIITPVWWSATIYEGEEKYNQSLAPFSTEQRNVYALLWYMAEVENGGHDQFYFNSTGIVWKDALFASKSLGLNTLTGVLEESAARMGGEPNLDRKIRQEQLKQYKPEFGDLDSQVLETDEEIYQRIYQYIVENRNAFYFEGSVKIAKSWAQKWKGV